MLEAWEQHLFENPEDLESKGVVRAKNAVTGHKFYKTGDPIIDAIEEAIGRGEDVDFNHYFGDVREGSDIFREMAWEAGQAVAPPEAVSEGVKVEHVDFASEDWLKDAENEDPILQRLAAKMRGGSNG